MQVLTYAGLDLSGFRGKFDKVSAAIERGDFGSIDLKKLVPTPYYRAKLDDASRLLLRFVRHGDRTACLALEVIAHHAYHKSRFLRGARIDEALIEAVTPAELGEAAEPLRYLNPTRCDFHLLDKPICFDDAQDAIYRLPPPLILAGSAGSGKTALTLAKLREAEGEVLYVTQSAWLAQSARALYEAHGYQNPAQHAQFLSYREFLETLRVPPGREVTFAAFAAWFERHRQHYRDTAAHPCFEEFRGVIGSQPEGVLSRGAYMALGPRQSIFAPKQREAIYALFEKYRQWLDDSGLFDSNLVAHQWRALAEPQYDFLVVDEVQDLTNTQLALLLRTLKHAGQFLLCGDSNQIVHPNFFSWSAVKSLFWRDSELAERQTLSVLAVNYRNTRAVTRMANMLLKIKHARFGSIDRESNHLVQPASDAEGEVRLMPDKDAVKRDLDARSRASTRFAVLVLRDEDKAEARAVFRTPLVFSVHEAKGLEYPNVILYRLVSGQRQAYAAICEGVDAADLEREELNYRRAKDKADRSLELWKFYVNALYVAITRAVERLYLVESDLDHPLLQLLGLRDSGADIDMPAATSSREEWEREAHRLEQQGKQEQADAIRQNVLRTRSVPWPVWDDALLQASAARAYDAREVSNKPRQQLLDMALWHYLDDHILALHEGMRWPAARQLVAKAGEGALVRARQGLVARFAGAYEKKNFREILQQCDQYGVDHRTVTGSTALMLAAVAGNVALLDALIERGADIAARDMFGHTAQLQALARAARESDYAAGPFEAVWQRVAAPFIDLEIDGRLVRLHQQQGEYLPLQLMLAGLKTLASHVFNMPGADVRRLRGFDAAYLMRNIESMPHAVWREDRRKRVYFNAVLARAEVDSDYRPARRLWLRMRNGHYLPNPAMRLRVHDANGQQTWQPIYVVLNLPAIERGNGRGWGMLGGAYRQLLELGGLPVQDELPRGAAD
ncbi:AAA family ATPase [Xanthomonas campestris pv. badrii]|uniref:AAA family ATPase n=1 Tax=Xanthomonas campestris pv. badrii TaxID=149696 RepID=A0A7Z2V9M0_XANCA|nr:AAA family ATPase [Xanthomonas campestris]QJD67600.1 AAA family ATPase [Xanthomonas campestris pv. badrii]